MGLVRLLQLMGLASVITASLFFFLPRTNPIHAIDAINVESLSSVAKEMTKLDTKYCVKYGDKSSPIKIVEFFSFQCPHCIKLFREDFSFIKKEFIDHGKAYFEFHPVPNDLITLQALICFEHLNEEEKCLFLEVIFEEADPWDSELMAKLMMTAMNVFKKPIPYLNDDDFLREHEIFKVSHDFLMKEQVNSVPSAEINGILFASEVPDYQFIKKFIKE